MQLTKLGRRFAVTVATTVAMLGGIPSTHAAGGAACTVDGVRENAAFAVYDLTCAGTPDMNGVWHLQEFGDGSITGTGPNGAVVNGAVDSTSIYPICVVIPSSWRLCKSISLTVCIDNWCYTKRVTICIWYTGPGAKVCIDIDSTGPFTGEGEMHTITN